MTLAADDPGGAVAGREVPAFDLPGMLVDPIAVSSEPWVNRSAVPFGTIGQPPDLTVPALDRLPAALAG